MARPLNGDEWHSREEFGRPEDNRVDCSLRRSMESRAFLVQRWRLWEESILVRIQWRKRLNERKSNLGRNKSRDVHKVDG